MPLVCITRDLMKLLLAIALVLGLLPLFGAGIAHAEQKTLCETGCDWDYESCGKCKNAETGQYGPCNSKELWSDRTAIVAVTKGVSPKVWDCELVNDYYISYIDKESGYFVGYCACTADYRKCLLEAYADYTACLNMKDDQTPYSVIAASCGQSADMVGASCAMSAGSCYSGFMPSFCQTRKESCLIGCKKNAPAKPAEPVLGQTQSILEGEGNASAGDGNASVPEFPAELPPSPTGAPACPFMFVILAVAGLGFVKI